MSDARLGDPVDQQAQESLTPRKRGLFRRGEDGLTTLEWLLIVAAVAGLAALAVVLVTNVVDQTAEQIGGSSARKTVAQVAAAQVTQNAYDDAPDDADAWTSTSADYKKKCDRLKITYGDVSPSLVVTWKASAAPLADQSSLWQAAINATSVGCTVT